MTAREWVMFEMALYEMLTLHTLDGRTVYVNPSQVISMAHPKDSNDLLVKGIQCIITLADGKFISAKETCEQVQDLMGRTE